MAKKNIIRLTESELKKVITESVKKVLNEDFGTDMDDTLAWVQKKRPDLSQAAQRKFAANIMAKKAREAKIPQYAPSQPKDDPILQDKSTSKDDIMSSLDRIDDAAREMQSIYFDNERWFDTKWYGNCLGFDNAGHEYGTIELYYALQGQNPLYTIEECLHQLGVKYYMIKYIADNEGYGMGAASRGFDVTRPMGRYWTLASKAIRVIQNICKVYNIDTRNWEAEGRNEARAASQQYHQWMNNR
jgi:hypothetical protein